MLVGGPHKRLGENYTRQLAIIFEFVLGGEGGEGGWLKSTLYIYMDLTRNEVWME